MKVIGSGTTFTFILGIIIGIIGLVGMGINYPLYNLPKTNFAWLMFNNKE